MGGLLTENLCVVCIVRLQVLNQKKKIKNKKKKEKRGTATYV